MPNEHTAVGLNLETTHRDIPLSKRWFASAWLCAGLLCALPIAHANDALNLQLQTAERLERVPAPTSAAAPTPAITAPEGERVIMGTGDQINIAVFGQPDLTTQVVLDGRGQITLPLIGPVSAAGLQPRELEKLVAKRLVEGGYLTNADVVVNVQQLRSRFFSVLGAVARPGRYPLENSLSVLDALAEAGGATDRAEPAITLIRAEPSGWGAGDTHGNKADEKGAMPPERLVLRLDPKAGPDVTLATTLVRNRDVLFVPTKPPFYVYGEVRAPGVYAVEPGMNLLKALSMAGGITERGSDKRVVITRPNPTGGSTDTPATLQDTVQPGDVITVKERLF